jgi:hypothetical protein
MRLAGDGVAAIGGIIILDYLPTIFILSISLNLLFRYKLM